MEVMEMWWIIVTACMLEMTAQAHDVYSKRELQHLASVNMGINLKDGTC